ncbi:MAG TPA: glycosyltransferase family 4 protein [Clostridiaceae bacterium]|nr:glycosyltransferase family 4 protein [Clostridiaceae bacterium]
MNILFVTHHDKFQGSSRSLMSLIEGLQEYDVTPFVVNPRGSIFTEALRSKDIRYAILPVPWWVSRKTLSCKKKIDLFSVIQQSVQNLQKVIRDWEIDLVYTNSSVTPVGLLAARRERVPHIWHIREFGNLDFDLDFIYPKTLCKMFMRMSNATICHSKVVRNYYFKPGLKKVHQIYNGVALKDQFDERLALRQQSQKDRPFTFVMMSGITPKKGQEVAIRALAELRDKGVVARLVIGGSGKTDYLEHLSKLRSELDLEAQVEFTGFNKDPFPSYYAANCALICSENEAFSRVGLESMSTALSVIGKNSGGNPEIIKHGTTGFLYDSFEELVAYMKAMVEDPGAARQMGLAGWQRARDLFNIEDYAAKVYRVIQSVMEKR